MVSKIIDEIIEVEQFELCFAAFTKKRPDLIEAKKIGYIDDFQKLFNKTPPEHHSNLIKEYYTKIVNLSRANLELLIELLERLVKGNIVSARIVCECAITSDELTISNIYFWNECFKLIRNIIDQVEYKGVREILKGCCEKAKTLPWNLNPQLTASVDALKSVVERILDKNACLLPGYLVINEFQKAYPDCPHWCLSTLFSEYVDSFRPCAQMVSIIGHAEMRPLVEHSGCPEHLVNPWKLDPLTLRFMIKETLPYAPELTERQTGLLRYVLQQPFSRDMVCGMLGLQKQQKQHCPALEEQLVEFVILALERTQKATDETEMEGLWLHLSSQLIYFVLFQFASFSNIVMSLHSRLQGRDITKARDHLMWVMLQFISGSIQRNPLSTFLPVLNLYELLYPDEEAPLEVPDYQKPQCTRQMAVTCVWIHLIKKAQLEMDKSKTWTIPEKLRKHYEFLQTLTPPTNTGLQMGDDFRVTLLCNAYSTNSEYFSKPMAALIETILGNQKQNSPAPTAPLNMAILDSLTVHSKMSLIHSIVTHVIKLAQTKSGMPLAPALVETYSRLLVYTEIESLGIKGFISQLLPTVYKSHAWGTLYTLLEMFSYRMHHIHPHYRVQLLSHLHSLAAVPQANQIQLHLCVESTALRLITGLGNVDVQPELSRFLTEPKALISAESEELNRALVVTLARATHITGIDGSWCTELLATIQQSTPHIWPPHIIEFFPKAIADFFLHHNVPKENKQLLKKAVEEEYRKWTSMNNDNDIMAHFGVPGAPPLFLCLLWKMLLEKTSTTTVNPIIYKILERIGARNLAAHFRKFCDCLVFEFANSAGGVHVNKCVDTINEMIWQYNFFTIDRFVLCLSLRTGEGNEGQVAAFIIQLVLLKATEFRNRVQDFVKDNTPDHWNQINWHEKHVDFHRKYPEKFAPEEQSNVYHSYFGNVCLRFLPVFDIVIQRFLEITQVAKSLEIILEHLGGLYKFHDRPVTFLYNTLHYYEVTLRNRVALRRKLLTAVLGHLTQSLTEPYQLFLQRTPEEVWLPELDYFLKLIKRVVDVLNGNAANSMIDWRFNEFPNAGAHILYLTCVEIMGLSAEPMDVGNNLLNVVVQGHVIIPAGEIHQYINAVGLVFSALPVVFWNVLYERLLSVLTELESWSFNCSPFRLFSFKETFSEFLQNNFSFTLALAHSVWHHAGPGQILSVAKWVRERLLGVVRKEEQFLYVCHLVGPFLQRFNGATMNELTVTLYKLLAQVDRSLADTELKYMDPICDFFYHIKYMFIGDTMKNELEVIVRTLRPQLQMRLRFIAHLTIEEVNAS